MSDKHFTRHFRVSMTLFLSALYFFFAVGIWAVNEQKFGISADLVVTQKSLTTQGEDLKKGLNISNGQLEFVDNALQLKANGEFTDWEKKTNFPTTEVKANGSVIEKTKPVNGQVSYDSVNDRYLVRFGPSIFSYTVGTNTWKELFKVDTLDVQTGFDVFWSDSRKKLLANILCNDKNVVSQLGGSVGEGAAGLDVVAFGPDSTGNCEKLIPGSSFTPAPAVSYYDPKTEQIFMLALGQGPTLGSPESALTPALANSVFLSVFDSKNKKSSLFTETDSAGATKVTNWPTKRLGATLAFDPDQSKVYVFGGAQGPEMLSDVWAFDLASQKWTEEDSFNTPAGRAFSSSVYDQKNKRFVLVGGLTQESIFSTTSGSASQKKIGCPGGVADGGCSLANLVSNITNGKITYVASNQTFSYVPTKNTWEQIKTKNDPTARFGHALSYDAKNQQLLLVGGLLSGEVTFSKGTFDAFPTFNGGPASSQETFLLKSTTGFAPLGTCQFDMGGPLVQRFTKFTSIKKADLPASTSVMVEFAGSTDGVNFGNFSDPVLFDGKKDTADTIDLTKLVQADSRFLRTKCSLATSDPKVTPTLAGFTVSFDELANQTVATTPTPGVTTTTPDTSVATPAPTPTASSVSPTPLPTILPDTPAPSSSATAVAVAPTTPAQVFDKPIAKDQPVQKVEKKPEGIQLVATGGSLGFNLLIAALLAILTTYLFLRRHPSETPPTA